MIPYQHQDPAVIPVHHTAFPTVKQTREARRVSFKPTVTVQPVEQLVTTQEDKSRLHYSKDEMDAFSLEVKAIRTLSKDLPAASSPCSAHATRKDCVLRLEADPALRGLELYLCPIRVRNKVLASNALIKYHRNLKTDFTKTDGEKLICLATASAKLGQWSKQVAMETARLDSLRAFDREDYLIPINEPVDISPFPVKVTKRSRRVTCDEDSQPTKRRRSRSIEYTHVHRLTDQK